MSRCLRDREDEAREATVNMPQTLRMEGSYRPLCSMAKASKTLFNIGTDKNRTRKQGSLELHAHTRKLLWLLDREEGSPKPPVEPPPDQCLRNWLSWYFGRRIEWRNWSAGFGATAAGGVQGARRGRGARCACLSAEVRKARDALTGPAL